MTATFHGLAAGLSAAGAGAGAAAPLTVFRVLRDHRRVLTTLGFGVIAVAATRAARNAIVPLWAEAIGLDATSTSIVFGLSGAADMLLFYPAGWAMDRFGRVHVAVPSMLVLGLGMVLVPFASTFWALVVVATADTVLNLPDYRAGESTYQLLEQVSGRAGRGEKAGEVIIQTYWPEHRAIVAASRHDRDYFYDFESQVRHELEYPPFRRLANVIVSSFNQSEAQEAAQNLAHILSKSEEDIEILGPAPCVIEKISKKYRNHFLVKSQREKPLGKIINDAARSFRCPKGVGIAIDVDPLSLM